MELVHHLAARSSAGGASDIHGLLQLLLALTAHPEVSGPAASAMRAVTAAALQMSWVALHLLAPMLLQVLAQSQHAEPVQFIAISWTGNMPAMLVSLLTMIHAAPMSVSPQSISMEACCMLCAGTELFILLKCC